MIRLSKIVVQLCYTFDANQRWSNPNFRAVAREQPHPVEVYIGIFYIPYLVYKWRSAVRRTKREGIVSQRYIWIWTILALLTKHCILSPQSGMIN